MAQSKKKGLRKVIYEWKTCSCCAKTLINCISNSLEENKKNNNNMNEGHRK